MTSQREERDFNGHFRFVPCLSLPSWPFSFGALSSVDRQQPTSWVKNVIVERGKAVVGQSVARSLPRSFVRSAKKSGHFSRSAPGQSSSWPTEKRKKKEEEEEIQFPEAGFFFLFSFESRPWSLWGQNCVLSFCVGGYSTCRLSNYLVDIYDSTYVLTHALIGQFQGPHFRLAFPKGGRAGNKHNPSLYYGAHSKSVGLCPLIELGERRGKRKYSFYLLLFLASLASRAVP